MLWMIRFGLLLVPVLTGLALSTPETPVVQEIRIIPHPRCFPPGTIMPEDMFGRPVFGMCPDAIIDKEWRI